MIFPWVSAKKRSPPPFRALQRQEAKFVGGRLPGGFSIRGLSGGERRRLNIAAGAGRCGGRFGGGWWGEKAMGFMIFMVDL